MMFHRMRITENMLLKYCSMINLFNFSIHKWAKNQVNPYNVLRKNNKDLILLISLIMLIVLFKLSSVSSMRMKENK